MSGSLLMVVQNTHPTEPLPAYRRDPETSSIRSSAPSYVSEAPTYRSTIPASPRIASQRVGLPPAHCAPGFIQVRSVDRNGLTHLNFSMNQWSSTHSSPQARHYHNVAARRTNLAMIEEQNFLAALTNQMVFPTFPIAPMVVEDSVSTATMLPVTTVNQEPSTSQAYTPVTSASSAAHQTETATSAPLPTSISANEPLSPHEDPDLVGHAAATVARERRLYIARETQSRRQQEERDAAAIREESRRWDFLLAQMSDWDERERGWKAFSKKMESKTNKSSARKVLFRFWK